MTFEGDPHRVLGVAPGATANEIRSAYRRLVKQWHPDAAGERALPRFLAIQAAYERLIDGEGRLRAPTAQGRATPRPPTPRPGYAWRADASRARASRDAWRARRAGWTAGPGGGHGAGASAGPGTAGTGGSGGSGGSPGSGGATEGRSAPGAGAGAGHRERRGHHRVVRKATPGSTTYDEAADNLDPRWGGATWYGASSGTYWTLNPREYADPRKHGPEYLARARRSMGGEAAPAPASGPDRAGAAPGVAGDTEAGASDAWRWTPAGGTTTQGDPHAWGARAWSFETGSVPDGGPAPGDRRRTTPSSARGEPRAAAVDPAPVAFPDLEALLRRVSPANLARLAAGPDRRWRVLLALAAWPPIGYAAATLLDAITGCGAYAAGCTDVAQALPVLVQPLIVAVLAAVPSLGAAAAFASLVGLAVALPAAAILQVFRPLGVDVVRWLIALTVAVAWLVAFLAPPLLRYRAGRSQPPSPPPGGSVP